MTPYQLDVFNGMQWQIKELQTLFLDLASRVLKLEQRPEYPDKQKPMGKPVPTVHGLSASQLRSLLPPGYRVLYDMPWRSVRWTGTVIPRPYNMPALSEVSRKPLTYVMRDGDHKILGCFAHNLVILA